MSISNRKVFVKWFLFFFIVSITIALPIPTFAYTTNMNASIVLGQPNFTSRSTYSAAANTIDYVEGIHITENKLFVPDCVNNRVLIWNSIPTSSNTPADVVVGQTNFTNNSENQGGSPAANTLNCPINVTTAGNKLIVSEWTNRRVLVYNTIPTSNNASADVVIGQPNMSTVTAGTSATKLDRPWNMEYDQSSGKLFISDYTNNRVLIYNRIPTDSGAAADIVIGQTNFTNNSVNQGGSPAANTLRFPFGIKVVEGKLIIADEANSRVLIYNSIPSVNNASADVVIGQPNFTSNSTNQGGSPAANTMNEPYDIAYDGKRLFVADTVNHRVLIFNGIPTSNNASAYMVLGQPNFTSRSLNQSSTVNANTLNWPEAVSIVNNKLALMDSNNYRILIFENIEDTPGLSVNSNTEGREGGLLRMTGTASLPTSSIYSLSSVQFSVNGGGFNNAVAKDGNFNDKTEEFYFDFDPKSNQPTDSSGNKIEGYTIRVKSLNNNLDAIDNLFFFTPFNQVSPGDNGKANSNNLEFQFNVIKQRSVLKDNLSKYLIQTRAGGNNSTASWSTYIDEIPVEGTLDGSGGISYENNNFKAEYTEDFSKVKVTSKLNTLSGTTSWRVVAIDKSGHEQTTGIRTIQIKGIGITNTPITSVSFPLAVLNISGLGNPDISTTNLGGMKESYTVNSTNPIFYGIANVGSTVTLELTDSDCQTNGLTDCIKTFDTTTNAESRFGINVPTQTLQSGKTYSTNMTVSMDNNYNELPTFDLTIQ